MYYKLNEKEKEIMEKVSNQTYTDYELEGDFIPVESLMSAIEDLLLEIEHQQECYEDLERDLEDNYRPIPQAEQYDVSDSDFI
jgi:hypothetical protein